MSLFSSFNRLTCSGRLLPRPNQADSAATEKDEAKAKAKAALHAAQAEEEEAAEEEEVADGPAEDLTDNDRPAVAIDVVVAAAATKDQK